MESFFFGIVDIAVHKDRTHFVEFGTLKWFGWYICPHFVGVAVFKVDFSGIIVVFDEKIFGFDVFGSFGTGDPAILCKQ
jgi:hypothetical protein